MKQEDKDDLIKALTDTGFSQEEIDGLIAKAEADGKFEEKEEKDEKTVDEQEQEKGKEGMDDDRDEMKKAYDKVMDMKSELDKAMDSFFDKFGSVPGFTKPEDPFKSKSIETDIEKAEVVDIQKSFDTIQKGFTDMIEKAFADQSTIIDDLKKSLGEVKDDIKKVAEAPNPFKSLTAKYQFIEKGENADGKQSLSLARNKHKVIDTFVKSLDKIENEEDQNVVRNMISDFTIANKTNEAGLNIVSKAMEIDFEK